MHTSKTYSSKDRSRNSSEYCLIVAVQEVSVLHLPPPILQELNQSLVAHTLSQKYTLQQIHLYAAPPHIL